MGEETEMQLRDKGMLDKAWAAFQKRAGRIEEIDRILAEDARTPGFLREPEDAVAVAERYERLGAERRALLEAIWPW